jgi:hypothetical protein
MAMMSDEYIRTPADIAMDEAIDLDINEGRKLYPDGSIFVDADGPNLGVVIARAADEGRTVVLCYEDGTRRIVEARRAPSAA